LRDLDLTVPHELQLQQLLINDTISFGALLWGIRKHGNTFDKRFDDEFCKDKHDTKRKRAEEQVNNSSMAKAFKAVKEAKDIAEGRAAGVIRKSGKKQPDQELEIHIVMVRLNIKWNTIEMNQSNNMDSLWIHQRCREKIL
jgi:hypothetical protein